MATHDRAVLRGLALRYAEISTDPEQEGRRDLWRRHNSLKPTRPLIYVSEFAFAEMEAMRCVCEDPLLRTHEFLLRHQLFSHSLGDDSVFEPWVTMSAAYKCTGWGVTVPRHMADTPRGTYKADYPIKDLADAARLRAPWHEIDEEQTSENLRRLGDAIGDIIAINVDRGPFYRTFMGDISYDLGHLRGIEHFMVDMIENPKWLHGLLQFMSEGILRTHDEAEAAGDWGLCSQHNQAMTYSEELPDPAPNVNGVKRSRLWAFMAAQEFAGVSPAMHEEFMLRYQLPILEPFGLVAYGCCEDLTRKIDMVRRIPNLRRIAVTPYADVARCAEQIGRDYILSYRPNPSDMVSYGWDPSRVRAILEQDLGSCTDCHVDITLKDVQTVQGDPNRVRNWVQLTRQIIDEVWE